MCNRDDPDDVHVLHIIALHVSEFPSRCWMRRIARIKSRNILRNSNISVQEFTGMKDSLHIVTSRSVVRVVSQKGRRQDSQKDVQ